ncbi:hypothetical protein BH11BAC2_BH11BAC2_24760 [soil metagenome]
MSGPVLIYLSPYDILRPRTNQVSDVRFCEGFAQNDCEVHLIVPFVYRNDNIPKEEIARYYGLEKDITVHYLPYRFKSDINGKWDAIRVALLDFFKVLSLLKKMQDKDDVIIISRSTFLLRPLLFLRKIFPNTFDNTRIIHWAHDFKNRKSWIKVYKDSDALLATNSSILQDMVKAAGTNPDHATYTLNPITASQVKERVSKEDARKELGLDKINKPLIVYTGKIGINYEQEIIHILGAAGKLSEYQFLLTGGKPEALKKWQQWCEERNISNVRFTGYLTDYTRIRYYQQAADVLVSYYTRQGHDIRYNLPNKLCEYMLSGNVIVSPDYPATQDLLHSNNCIFAKPEDTEELAEKIRYAINHPEISHQLAMQALEDVQQITFQKRTAALLEFFKRLKNKSSDS